MWRIPAEKSRSENFITKFARYTPIVCYSALALALLPPIVLFLCEQPVDWGDWITRALTFWSSAARVRSSFRYR
ncbi:MAG: hypothetical protein ACLVJ6_15510 [Merdibacter sp.]